MASLTVSNGGARPITMLGLFAAILIVGGFLWFAVIDTRAARERAELLEAARQTEQAATQAETPQQTEATPPADTTDSADSASTADATPDEGGAAAGATDAATADGATPPADDGATPPETGAAATTDAATPAQDQDAAAPVDSAGAEDAAAQVDTAPAAAPPPATGSEAATQIVALSEAIGELRAGQATTREAIAALERQVAELQAAWNDQVAATSRQYSLVPMVGEVRMALAQGVAYAGAIRRIEFIAGDRDDFAPALRTLSRTADGRLLSDRELADNYYRLMPRLQARARVLAADGFFGRLMARLASVITVGRTPTAEELARLISPPQSADDPATLIRLIQFRLSRDNVAGAITAAEMLAARTGEGDLPAAFNDWLDRAKARRLADAAADELEQAIVQSITALSSG